MAELTLRKCEYNGVSKENNGCVSSPIDSFLWIKHGRSWSEYSRLWRRRTIKPEERFQDS